jgi:hypothetical protein
MSLLTRTDDDRAVGAPFTVRLGGGERPLRPLPLKHSRGWKKKLNEALTRFGDIKLDVLDANGQLSLEAIQPLIKTVAVTLPDVLADLVWAYVHAAEPELSKEWFEDSVNDEEIVDALLRMIEVTFPFLRRMGSVLGTGDLTGLVPGSAPLSSSPGGNGGLIGASSRPAGPMNTSG